jgi:hypothetical protein
MIVFASAMLAGAIFIPVFVVVESAEVGVTLANDLDKDLNQELQGDEHGDK